MTVGGLDVGTTGSKITVFSLTGEELGCYYREYPDRTNPGEADAKIILSTVEEILKEAAKNHPDLAAFGVTSFGEAFVLTDKEGEPLAPIWLCSDARGAAECEELTEKIGKERWMQIAGAEPNTMYSLAKILWAKNNLQNFPQTEHIYLMEDYIVHHLTGVAQIDYSLAARTMAFDVRNLCFSEEILSAAEVSVSLFSKPVPTGTAAGPLRDEIGNLLGFQSNPTVVSGAHDQVAAALGSGITDGSVAVDGTGTVECVTVCMPEPPDDPAYYACGFCAVPYIVPGTYVNYAFTLTGGACAKWVRDKITPDLIRDNPGKNVYRILDESMPKEPTNLLILPHFSGSATPYMDAGSRAAILGLDLTTDRFTLYRGVLEGVTMEMKQNLERLKEFGAVPRRIIAAGGGAKSPPWLQMKADIFDCPIETLRGSEAGAAGTAMMAAVACGLLPDLREAVNRFVHRNEVYVQGKNSEAYQRIFKRYRRVYDAVRPLMEGENDEN